MELMWRKTDLSCSDAQDLRKLVDINAAAHGRDRRAVPE
jgi:hypothetical protein